MNQTTERKKVNKVSFKVVHDDIFNESNFLEREHDTQQFASKARLLQQAGFVSSIATKLYDQLSSKANELKVHNQKYKGTHKLLLEPQLERVCEKYDLYVRKPEFFIGDIPVKNVRDISEFWVYLSDIIDVKSICEKQLSQILQKLRESPYQEDHERAKLMNITQTECYCNYCWLSTKETYNPKLNNNSDLFKVDPKITISELKNVCSAFKLENNFIEIAAVSELFSEEAFSVSKSRIINTPELKPIGSVESDPIILFKTRLGRIIVTAWGDESNDELVTNSSNN